MVRRLAAGQQDAQPVKRGLLADAKIGRGVKGHRHAVRCVPLLQSPGVVAQSPRYRHDGHTVQKSDPQLQERDVEAGSRDERNAVLGREADRFPRTRGRVDQTVMLNQHALRHYRRS